MEKIVCDYDLLIYFYLDECCQKRHLHMVFCDTVKPDVVPCLSCYSFLIFWVGLKLNDFKTQGSGILLL